MITSKDLSGKGYNVTIKNVLLAPDNYWKIFLEF